MPESFWPLEEDRLVPESAFADQSIKAHVEYQRDPIGWFRDKLGLPTWHFRWSEVLSPDYEFDGSKDPLAMASEALAWWDDPSRGTRAVGIESATATGKSYWAACIILWFLACFPESEVYTFAPKADQLKLTIWKNITILWPKFTRHFPSAELTELTLRMKGGTDESWSAHGYAVGVKADEAVSTKASGMHAKHMLLVYEEATGIDNRVYEAGYNTCTAPHNLRLAIGNPNFQLDPLHRFCTTPGTTHVVASALDHPNVVLDDPNLISGAASRVSNENRLEKYGPNDPTYLARVRGISPEQAANALIRLEWIKRANQRWLAKRKNGVLPWLVTAKGVDAANSEHGDEACIADFADNALVKCVTFPCPDSNLLGDRIVREAHDKMARSSYPPLDPLYVGVDAIGVGAGTVNECNRQQYFVQALYAGGKPIKQTERAPDGSKYEWVPDANRHKNFRSQMYWQLREDLRKDVIDLPEDIELTEEMLAHTFEEDEGDAITLEAKAEIRATLRRSPNKSDAVAMGNWVRPRRTEAPEPGREKEEGVSLGFDYKKRRPATARTADEELSEMFSERILDPLADRNTIPWRGHR